MILEIVVKWSSCQEKAKITKLVVWFHLNDKHEHILMYYPNLLTSDEFQNRRNSGIQVECPFFIRLLQKNSCNTGFWESLAHFFGLSTGQKWMTTRWSNFDAVYHVMHDSTRYEVKKLLDLLDSNGISNTLALSYRFKGELFLQWPDQTDFLFCHNLDECLCPHIDFPLRSDPKIVHRKEDLPVGFGSCQWVGSGQASRSLARKGTRSQRPQRQRKSTSDISGWSEKWH